MGFGSKKGFKMMTLKIQGELTYHPRKEGGASGLVVVLGLMVRGACGARPLGCS